MNSELRESLQVFESVCHKELINQLLEQIKQKGPLKILDLSLDQGVFSHLITPHVEVEKIISAVRDDVDNTTNSNIPNLIEFRKVSLASKEAMMSSLVPLGTFDLIIVKEMISEVKDRMPSFFEVLKVLLKDDDSVIYLITRPKNPPLPVPQLAMDTWRKTLPSREEIFQAVFEVQSRRLLSVKY